MKKVFLLAGSGIIVAGLALITNYGQAASQPTYPISELGDCRDANECFLYCEIPAHKAACWSYGRYVLTSEQVLGETDTDTAATLQERGITFPIAELNNCNSVQQCKTYCDNPSHIDACRAFADQHQLNRAHGQYTAMLAHAKQELGCGSLPECRAYCAEPLNHAQCRSFAEQYAPDEYHRQRTELVMRAQETLGCESLEMCRAYCAEPNNQDQCLSFAKEYAPAAIRSKVLQHEARLRQQIQELPCQTLAECRTFCTQPENATRCRMKSDEQRFKIELQQEEKYTCTTEAECRRWCQANPERCPGYTDSIDYQQFEAERARRQHNSTAVSPRSTDARAPDGLSPDRLQRYELYRQQFEQENNSELDATTPPATTHDFD